MSIPVFNRTITDAEGNVIPNAQITVVDERTDTLATLFSNRDGDVSKSNPFTADTNGFAQFFAAVGVYRVTAEFGALTRTWRFESLLDNAVDIEWTGEQTFTDEVNFQDAIDLDGQSIKGNVTLDGEVQFDDEVEFTDKVTGPGELVNGKYVGELVMIPGQKLSPSAARPLLCLTTIHDVETISATNWPLLVPKVRDELLVFDEGGSDETSAFPGSASGSVITIDNTPANNFLLAALLEHLAAFNDDYDSLGVVRFGGQDFAITDINSIIPATITVTGTPTAGAGTAQFYPHRIAGSTTTARIQSWRGRSPIGANGAEGGTISGLMRRDQMQGHGHTFVGQINGSSGNTVLGFVSGGAVITADEEIKAAVELSPNGTPRTGTTTHSPDSAVNIYAHGGIYNA